MRNDRDWKTWITRMRFDSSISGSMQGWLVKELRRSASRRALDAWERAKELIAAGEHDLVVLDAFTYPLQYLWIDASDAAATIAERG